MKIFGITGWKDSGKTTLVSELVDYFSHLGYRVSTVKHAHHHFDLDQPGRDSYKHRGAGAHEVMIASAKRWALMHEVQKEPEPELDDLLQHMEPVDLVIVEGFKMAKHPKIQVVRPSHNTTPLPASAQPIVAIASDAPVEATDFSCSGPVLALNDIEAIANFIITYLELSPKISKSP